MVNRPGEVWIETAAGTITREAAPQITELALGRLARQIAAASHQGVNREQPLLSATLPDGGRVQIIAPPATRDGLVLAVRKHVISDLSLDELAGRACSPRRAAAANAARGRDAELAALLDRRRDGGLPEAGRAPAQDDRDQRRHRRPARPPCSTRWSRRSTRRSG